MREQVQQLIADGFGYLGDMLEPAEYQVVTVGYDPTTGEATQSVSTTTFSLFEDVWTWAEKQNLDIDAQDKKLIFMLDGLGVTPQVKDEIKIDSVIYTIRHVIDNNGILCTVQVQVRA